MFDIAREKVVCLEISNSEFKRDISMFAVSLRIFRSLPPRPLTFHRDIRADHSTLKLYFTPSNYTGQSGIGHIFFLLFILFLSLSLLVRFLLPFFTSPFASVYFRAIPPFVFIRTIGKGVHSRAFYLFSCFTA